MNIQEEPLAVIKIKFDEMPDNLNLFIGTGVLCLILINVFLVSQIICFYYSCIKSIYNSHRQYESI